MPNPDEHIHPCGDPTCSVCGNVRGPWRSQAPWLYPDTIRQVTVESPDGEVFDLVVMCRYITYMYGVIQRLEPVIDDIGGFIAFMKMLTGEGLDANFKWEPNAKESATRKQTAKAPSRNRAPNRKAES